MAAIFSFVCSECGEVHEGSPSLGLKAPDPYLEQPPEVQEAGELSDDWCWYVDDDGQHYFIRVCLEIPIHGAIDPFLWGVWVSLSRQSFERYMETYDEPDENDSWFGWLCNYLPGYPNTYALKTKVSQRPVGERPLIALEESGHPLARDFFEGLSVARAQAIAEEIMHR